MTHLVGNIRKRRLAYLEQACERYAIMAYEVLRRELAMGFKSVSYSYKGNGADERVGTFTATFVPWEQTDKYRHGHRATEVKFNVSADTEEDQWTLSQGTMSDIESGMAVTIRFERSGHLVALNIPEWDEIRFANNAYHSSDTVTPLNKEPWGTFSDRITI